MSAAVPNQTQGPPPGYSVESENRWRAAQRWLGDRPAIALTVILGLLLLVTGVESPHSVAPSGLSTILLFAAFLATLAAGQTLVMLTAGIDLSVASTATAASYFMAALNSQGHSLPIALLGGLAIGLVIGLFNGVGVGIFGVQPLIMTLGTQSIITGALTVYTQRYFTGAPIVPGAIHQLGAGTLGSYVPISLLVVWLPLSLLLVFGLPRAGLGRAMYAVGDNPLACRLAGIRVWQVLVAAYTLCGLLSALAGFILVGYVNAPSEQLASAYLLVSVAAVVIGGTSIFGGIGSYSGTILGALILSVLDTLLNVLNAPQAVREVLYGAAILVLATLYSRAFASE
jgi:ribose transport system permease protein